MAQKSPSKSSGKSLGKAGDLSPIRGRETTGNSRPTSKANARTKASKSPPKSKHDNIQYEITEPRDYIDKVDNPLIQMIESIESVNIVIELEIEKLAEANPLLIPAVDTISQDTAMHCACSRIHFLSTSIVCCLIDSCGKALHFKNSLGMTPLHKAVMAKPRFISTRRRINEREEDALFRQQNPLTIDSIYMLIEAYPDALFAQNIEGQTPLHCCLSHSHDRIDEIIECLLEEAPGLKACSIVDKYGYCPLHVAASNRYISDGVLSMILSAYPEATTIQDAKGNSPLHWAVATDNPRLSIVEVLVDADPRQLALRNGSGLLPADMLMLRPRNDRTKACLALLLDVTAAVRPASRIFSPEFMNEPTRRTPTPAKSGRLSPSQLSGESSARHLGRHSPNATSTSSSLQHDGSRTKRK